MQSVQVGSIFSYYEFERWYEYNFLYNVQYDFFSSCCMLEENGSTEQVSYISSSSFLSRELSLISKTI